MSSTPNSNVWGTQAEWNAFELGLIEAWATIPGALIKRLIISGHVNKQVVRKKIALNRPREGDCNG